MVRKVQFTEEFGEWWSSLTEGEQDAIDVSIGVLKEIGPSLGRPQVDTVKGSRHSNMKELRTQYKGNPYRTFFAFDPKRNVILLIGGNKKGNDRFYEEMVPIADRLYDRHLEELEKEKGASK